MFRRLYYTTALALLPSVEGATKGFERLVAKLDARTQHLEGLLEEQAVVLAKKAQQRRSALDSLYGLLDKIETTVDNIADSIHAAFTRRERAAIAEIGKLRSHLEAASAARDAVANALKL